MTRVEASYLSRNTRHWFNATPSSFGEMNTYSYDGDGDVVMQNVEDLKAIMDVMHHVHEKRFRDEQLYHREVSSSRVRILCNIYS